MTEKTRVFARKPDGTEVDVTEGVQALYDHCIQSMDWGSGFLSIEDAKGIIRIAQACGFLMPEDAAKAFDDYAKTVSTNSDRSSVICALCGEKAYWTSDRYDPPFWGFGEFGTPYEQRSREWDKVAKVVQKAGWYHVGDVGDSDPGHKPILWR